MSEPKECILVNIMYSGDYLNEKRSSSENIGHEWINLVKPDDPNEPHYIYITKDGKLDHNKYKISTVLFARAISKERGNNRVEVIAKATGCNPVKESERKKIGEINYGGVPLSKIFANNKYKNISDPFSAILATFTAQHVFRASQRIVLSCEKNNAGDGIIGQTNKDPIAKLLSDPSVSGTEWVIKLDKCPNNQALRLYIDDEKHRIQDVIIENAGGLWEQKEVGCLNPADVLKDGETISSCFLTIIGKLYDELSYSNMIAHFLRENNELCNRFLEELNRHLSGDTKMELEHSATYSIEREEDHIDLIIRDSTNKYLIVIENKIRSGINGKKKRGRKDQLHVYAEKAFYKCETQFFVKRTKKNSSKREKQKSRQRSKLPARQDNPDYNRQPLFFILTPKYNSIADENAESVRRLVKTQKDTREVFYHKISYGELYQFFERENPNDMKHFNEFLTALRVHDRATNNINELLMRERVVNAINRERNNTPTT